MRAAKEWEASHKTAVIVTLHADPVALPGAGAAGGTHSYVAELLEALPDRGWRCIAVTRRVSDSQPEVSTVRDGATIVRITVGNREPMDKRLLDHFHSESLAAVRRVVEDIGHIDILHSVYWNSGRVVRDLARELRMRYVHTVISNGRRREIEGATPGPPERFGVERSVFRSAFRIFSVAAEERNDLAMLYGINPRQILIVGRPVDRSFQVAPSPSSPPRAFSYVGRLDAAKGVNEIIAAWLEISRALSNEIPLWIIGGTVEEVDCMRSSLRGEAGAAAERGSIRWWGRLDRPAISALLQQSFACVTHSLYEPGGRVVLEAMTAGVPVIATAHGFALEAIRHGLTGLLVNFGDIPALAGSMQRLALDRCWAEAIGRAGAQSAALLVARRRFLDKHTDAYELACSSVADERRRTHA